MSTTNTNLKAKLAAGTVLVALSGFVPQPLVSPALADTATIQAQGSFTNGLTLTAGANLQFGTNVPTAGNGSVSISPGGAAALSKAFNNGGVQTNGAINMKVATTGKVVNFTVTGQKNSLVLGAPTIGTVNLPTIKLTGPFVGTLVFTAAATTATAAVTLLSAPINVGGIVTWNATQPEGSFNQSVTVTAAF